MASAELSRLWKLHQIDAAIADVRNRAIHLDVGQKIQAEIDKIAAEDADVGAKARALAAELKDLELANKSIEDKLKTIDKTLYGGSVVSPREVQNYEKEIVVLKGKQATNDERILELWDLVPPAKEAADKITARLEDAKKRLAERKKTALAEKTAIEAEYARLNALRPDAAKGISSSLLVRYEDIRKRHGGIGMAQVSKKNTCTGCGTLQPERTLAGLKDDKVITCETCHRILYWTEGLV